LEALLERIDAEIAAIGGKRSKSRTQVMETFFRAGTHVTVDELTRAVRRRNRSVGYATVYRTVKLLARLDYVKELDFGDGQKRYESNLVAHHDHLVCQECGVVLEFKEPKIETLQERVAKKHGFRPTMHRLDIYGYCRRCDPATRKRDDR
jgi:Fur family transcriptional regulator, ferric uptake regulator